MTDGAGVSFSGGDVGGAVGSTIGSLIGAALGPAGAAVGGLIGGKAGGAVGNAVAPGAVTVGGKTASDDTSSSAAPVDDFSLPYGPGSAGPATAPGAMPDVVQGMVDASPGAGGDMGTINRSDPPPVALPSAPPVAPPSVTVQTPEAPPSITTQEPPPAPVVPPEPFAPPPTLAATRGPVRVVRGRGARRLLLFDPGASLASTLGGA